MRWVELKRFTPLNPAITIARSRFCWPNQRHTHELSALNLMSYIYTQTRTVRYTDQLMLSNKPTSRIAHHSLKRKSSKIVLPMIAFACVYSTAHPHAITFTNTFSTTQKGDKTKSYKCDRVGLSFVATLIRKR